MRHGGAGTQVGYGRGVDAGLGVPAQGLALIPALVVRADAFRVGVIWGAGDEEVGVRRVVELLVVQALPIYMILGVGHGRLMALLLLPWDLSILTRNRNRFKCSPRDPGYIRRRAGCSG